MLTDKYPKVILGLLGAYGIFEIVQKIRHYFYKPNPRIQYYNLKEMQTKIRPYLYLNQIQSMLQLLYPKTSNIKCMRRLNQPFCVYEHLEKQKINHLSLYDLISATHIEKPDEIGLDYNQHTLFQYVLKKTREEYTY